MKQVKQKIALSLLLTILGCISLYLIKPEKDYSKMEYDWFWTNKTFASQKASILFIGDSRVYRGVSPTFIEQEIPDHTVLNLGYSSGGLTKEMFDFSLNHLDRNHSERTIVLGITSYCFTQDARANEHLNQELSRPFSEIVERKYFNRHLAIFEPFELTDLKEDNQNEAHYYQSFYEQGWAKSNKIPANPNEANQAYIRQLSKTSLSQESIKETLDFTKEMTSHGVKMFAFRPPTTKNMENIENEYSSFDFDKFVLEFEAHGGEWIEIIDKKKYTSYDGSHLDAESAQAISTFLAQEINKRR